jgi:hypothetical protein
MKEPSESGRQLNLLAQAQRGESGIKKQGTLA